MMTETDGRVARRRRNRVAVLDALIALYEEGEPEPSVDQVSTRSGVSTRSVYRYFNSRDHLVHEAMWHLLERLQHEIVLDGLGEGPIDERIDRFVRHRVRMYFALAPLTRAARRSASIDAAVDHEFEERRMTTRQELLDHFAIEFERLDGRELTDAVIASDLAFQFDSFEYLHRSCEADVEQMVSILKRHLTVHMAPAPA